MPAGHRHFPPLHTSGLAQGLEVPHLHAPPVQRSALVVSQAVQDPPAVPHWVTDPMMQEFEEQQPVAQAVALQ